MYQTPTYGTPSKRSAKARIPSMRSVGLEVARLLLRLDLLGLGHAGGRREQDRAHQAGCLRAFASPSFDRETRCASRCFSIACGQSIVPARRFRYV